MFRFWFVNISSWLIFISIVGTNINIVNGETPNFLFIEEAYRKGDYLTVIFLGEQMTSEPRILRYVASSYAKIGHFSKAIAILKRLLDNPEVSNTSDEINLSQLLLIVGRYEEAKILALKVFNSLEVEKEKNILAHLLGNIYSRKGEYQKAISYYNQSLVGLTGESQLLVLNNLLSTQKLWIKKLNQEAIWANTVDQEITTALKKEVTLIKINYQGFLQEAIKLSQRYSGIESLRFFINYKDEIELFSDTQLLSEVEKLPVSLLKGEFFLKLNDPESALKVAQELNNGRLLSFSLGALGKQYKIKGNFPEALKFFLEAQQVALKIGARDSLYQWQWEAAKVYRYLNQEEKALIFYQNAINTLQSSRYELAFENQNISFFNKIQPLYLEALEYFLNQPITQSNLLKIKTILGLYQVSLVESYFNSPCPLELQSISLEKDQAFVYFISLYHQTYILLELPDSQLILFEVDLTKSELQELANDWLVDLKNAANDNYRILGKKLYHKLILPIESILLKHKIETLFIRPDGALQNVPLAALVDADDKFLIEKFIVVSSFGVKPIAPLKTKNRDSGTIFGLINPPPSSLLSPLPGVQKEVFSLKNLTNSISLLNQNFTYENFVLSLKQNEQKSFIHLATHGKFGGNAEQTWVQAYDQKIFLSQLENGLLSSSFPINLLVLSGCETSVGNNRTFLGMGGLALRTGVGTVISTLWQIYDEDSAILITDFYRNYQAGVEPIKAFRQAQLKALQDSSQHPYFWAGYVSLR